MLTGLTGKWTYRSYLNRTGLVDGDATAALALIFGEGFFDLADSDGRVTGSFGMATGYALVMEGWFEPATIDHAASFSLVGTGLAGTATAGWEYAYRGILSPDWSDAVAQIPCLVGTVLRVKAHGPQSPAGVTASFIAVRHDDNPPPRTTRSFSLLAG